MTRERREPESIRRKKRRRRSPEEMEQIRKRKRLEERNTIADKEISRKKKRRVAEDGIDRSKGKEMSIAKKALVITASILIFIIMIGVISIVKFFGDIENSSTIVGVAPGRNEPVNILVLGMDIGDPNQAGNKDIKRTDTIMLVNYNPESKDAKIVSIPRDTLVTENGKHYKINAAYQRGGDSKVKQVVEDMLSVNINYMVKIDYKAFRDFIDTIGGVNIDIERDMIYDDDAQDLHINLKKGPNQHLDGKKAEEFFRWRKNNDGSGFANGDLDRIENQHKFIQKVVDKCTSPTIVFKIPKILKTISSNMDSNMPASKMVSYGLKFMNLANDGLQMETIQGDNKTIGGESYVVFNKKANSQLLSGLHSSSNTKTSIRKENVKVLLLNGTRINGLASQVKGDLEAAGWTRVDTGNGDPTDKSIIKANDDEIRKLVNADIQKIKKSDKKPEDEKYAAYDVVIVIGNDYKKLGE
ncbi:LCP family protein [Clostridium paraputrificum]|uniref:LCP family protein n=1 Tax=Clostridium TaxID=1485 RepID=UPI003D352B34